MRGVKPLLMDPNLAPVAQGDRGFISNTVLLRHVFSWQLPSSLRPPWASSDDPHSWDTHLFTAVSFAAALGHEDCVTVLLQEARRLFAVDVAVAEAEAVFGYFVLSMR